MEISEAYLETAMKDLQAAQILYEKGLFQQSLFYLQQSSEKSNKSIFIFGGHFSPEQGKRKYGHNQLIAYKELLQKENEVTKALSQDESWKSLFGQIALIGNREITDYTLYIDQQRTLVEQLMSGQKANGLDLKPKYLKMMVNKMKEMKSAPAEIPTNEQMDSFRQVLINDMIKQAKKDSNLAELRAKMVDWTEKPFFMEYFKVFFDSAQKMGKINYIYSILAILTNGFENTRYPIPENSTHYLNINKKVPFITYQLELMDGLAFAHSLHKELYENYNRIKGKS